MPRKRPGDGDADGWKVGQEILGKVLHAGYCATQRVAEAAPALVEALRRDRARVFTHHKPIAPTGTISPSLANNASNGIEPFAHHMLAAT